MDLAADGVGVPLFRALGAELDDRNNDSRLALRLISEPPGTASGLGPPWAIVELRRLGGVVGEEHVGLALRHGLNIPRHLRGLGDFPSLVPGGFEKFVAGWNTEQAG